MEEYEILLDQETLKPFQNSGHAFVCFDSVASLNTILKNLRPTPKSHLKIFFLSIHNKLSKCCEWLFGGSIDDSESNYDSQGRAKSSFL